MLLDHLLMTPIIFSNPTKYGNLCHVLVTSFFVRMETLRISTLKSTIFLYSACRLGDNYGHQLITICNSNSNRTQKILVSMIRSGSFLAHNEENFVASHMSWSNAGNWLSSGILKATNVINNSNHVWLNAFFSSWASWKFYQNLWQRYFSQLNWTP